MFQLKDFVSISASMINRAKATQDKITDFQIGSVARTLMESPAIEIDEFYQRMFAGILEAIPTAIYKGFDFTLVEATASRGYVVVSFLGPIEEAFTVPAGSVFLAPASGLQYLSESDVNVPVGAMTASIVVTCTQTGTVGNLPVGSITQAQDFDFPVGASISNNLISSGKDAETEEERKGRFSAFVLSISRGTLASVRYAGASAIIRSPAGSVIEYVTRIGDDENIGHVDLYIYGSGGIASDELVAESQKLVDGYTEEDGTVVPGYRSAGVRVSVQKMTEKSVDVNINLTMFPGYDLTTEVTTNLRNAIESVIDLVESGGTLYMSSITDAAISVLGIKEAFVSNTANVQCLNSEVLRLGTLTASEVNA